jgi:hypothetical protein
LARSGAGLLLFPFSFGRVVPLGCGSPLGPVLRLYSRLAALALRGAASPSMCSLSAGLRFPRSLLSLSSGSLPWPSLVQAPPLPRLGAALARSGAALPSSADSALCCGGCLVGSAAAVSRVPPPLLGETGPSFSNMCLSSLPFGRLLSSLSAPSTVLFGVLEVFVRPDS